MMNSQKKIYNLKIKDRFLFLLIIIYPFLPLIKEKWSNVGNILEIFLISVLIIIASVKVDKKMTLVFSAKEITLVLFLFIYTLIASNLFDSFSTFRMFLLYIYIAKLIKLNGTKNMDLTIIHACIIVSLVMSIGAVLQLVYPETIASLHDPQTQYLLGGKTRFEQFSIYNRAISFMNDPNLLAVMLSFILIMLLEIRRFYRTANKSRITFLSLLISVAILLTQSRTGLFICMFYFIACLVRWIFNNGSAKRSTYILVLIFVVIFGFLIWKYLADITLYYRGTTILNGNGRVSHNQFHIKELLEQDYIHLLFGNGLTSGRGGLEDIFENTYLLLIKSFGIVGFIIFMILIFLNMRGIIKKSSILILLCALLANAAGDYLVIPQITLYALLGVLLLSRGDTNESFTNINASRNGRR